MSSEYEYLVESQWAGWWGGYGEEHVLANHLERRAAEGWRLAKVERGIYLWFWYIPRTKLLYFWERERTLRGSRVEELANRVEEETRRTSHNAPSVKPAPASTVPDSSTDEIETIEIAFPGDSVPRTSPIDFESDTPFDETYLERLGYENLKPSECRWEPGSTLVWQAFREHFKNELEKLGEQGWELIEPFEDYDEDGYLVNATDRFVFEELDEGDPSTTVFSGAEFQMQKRSETEKQVTTPQTVAQPVEPHAYLGAEDTGLCAVCGKSQHDAR